MRPPFIAGSFVAMMLVVACSKFGSGDTPVSMDAGSETDAAVPPLADGAPLDAPALGDGGDSGQPYAVLASGFSGLAGVAATESTVYFTERTTGIVRSVPLAGGAVTDVEATGGAPSNVIVVAGQTLFWTDFGQNKITRKALSGGPSSSFTPTPGKPPVALAAASDRIVVVAVAPNGSGDVQQYQFDFVGGPSVTNQKNPFDVAVSSLNEIFWTESSNATIRQGQAGDSTDAVFASNENDCQSIAADSLGVYWARPSHGLVRMKPKGGGGAKSLATAQKSPFSLAADTSGVYWMNAGDGTIRRSTRDELPIYTVASGFNAAFTLDVQAIALTATYVVWITNDGKVLRADK